MKTSDELFQLIKALDKSEKRYFKLYAFGGKSAKNNYQKLFEAIEAQEEYDEEAIRKTYAKETFIKQLHVTKNNLHQLILKSLRSYYGNKNVRYHIRNLLTDYDILYNKGLMQQCKKILRKIRQLSDAHKIYPYSLLAIAQEKILIRELYDLDKIAKIRNKLHEEEMAIMEQIDQLLKINHLGFRAFYLESSSRNYRNRDMVKDLEELISHPILQEEKNISSYQGKIVYYDIYANYYVAIGDDQNAFKNYQKLVRHCMDNIERMKEKPDNLISIVYNYFDKCVRVNKLDEITSSITELKSIIAKRPEFESRTVKARLFELETIVELNLTIMGVDIEKGIPYVEQMEKNLEEIGDSLRNDKKAIIYINIAEIYFLARDYKKALFWVNKIINSKESILRKDIEDATRIFNLINHFELGNFDLLNYLVLSVDQRLKKEKNLYVAERVVIKYLKKIINKEDSEVRKSLFKELKEELKELVKNKDHLQAFKNFDYFAWIESKIGGEDLADILRAKRKKKVA